MVFLIWGFWGVGTSASDVDVRLLILLLVRGLLSPDNNVGVDDVVDTRRLRRAAIQWTPLSSQLIRSVGFCSLRVEVRVQL